MFQDQQWCETRLCRVPLIFKCIYERNDDEGGENEDGKDEVRFLEERNELRLPDLLYVDD